MSDSRYKIVHLLDGTQCDVFDYIAIGTFEGEIIYKVNYTRYGFTGPMCISPKTCYAKKLPTILFDNIFIEVTE